MAEPIDPPKPTYWVPAAGLRGMTRLHHAAYFNDPELVRDLLAEGEPVDARDNAGWTPLHWAIDMAQAWGEPEAVVAVLLAAGASPNAATNDGTTALMRAAGRHNLAILDALLAAGADPQPRTTESTALHEAAMSGFTAGAVRLLERGADRTSLDERGRTPEQLARDDAWGFIETADAIGRQRDR